MTNRVQDGEGLPILTERIRDKDEAGSFNRVKTTLNAENEDGQDSSEDSGSDFSDTEDVLDLIAHMEKSKQESSPSPNRPFNTTGTQGLIDSSRAQSTQETQHTKSDIGPPQEPFTKLNAGHSQEELRQDLKVLGVEGFLDKYLVDRELSVRTILQNFGLKLPKDFEETDDLDLIPILRVYLVREHSKREKLANVNTIEDVATLLQTSKKIIVITGAGISTSLGIPDFRSEGGIYSRLDDYDLTDPQELFDIHLFRERPELFYRFAKELLPVERGYSPTHAFIRLLQDQGRLLRQYTQNIDNIESSAGIESDLLVQCHGSFKTATCLTCKSTIRGDSIFAEIRRGDVPKCWPCRDAIESITPKVRKRKRRSSWSEWHTTREEEENLDALEGTRATDYGLLKPDITFFGEQLSTEFKTQIMKDKDEVDLVLCIGTSLRVAPVADIPKLIPKHVPQIFISKEQAGKEYVFDVELLGACDDVVFGLVSRTHHGSQAEFKLLVDAGKLLAKDNGPT